LHRPIALLPGSCRAVCAGAIRTGEQVTSHLQTRKVLIYFCNDLVEGHWSQVYTVTAVLLADKTEQRGAGFYRSGE
jgi:hypothetical protein